jgi:O-antigen ligase
LVSFYTAGIFLYFRNSLFSISFEVLVLNMLFLMLLLVMAGQSLRRESIERALLYPAFIVLGFGILQIFKVNLPYYGDEFLSQGRIFSTLANPNNLALYANIIIFLSLYKYIEKKRLGYLALTVLGLVNLVFTKSGSGIAAFIFGLFILSFALKRSLRLLSAGLVSAILLIVSAGTSILKSESFLYRGYIWSDVYRIIRERPFLGWGLGSFSSIYPYFRNPRLFILLKDHQIEFLHPDNYFLNLVVEGGLFYLLLFLFVNGALIFYLFKYRGRSYLNFSYSAILGAMLFQNIFSQSFYSFSPYFFYLLMFSLTMRQIDLGLTRRAAVSKLKIPVLTLFAGLNLVVGYYGLRIFTSEVYLKEAVYYSQIRRLKRAEGLYRSSIEHNYFNPLPHYLLGNLYLEDGDENNIYKALRHYNNVEFMAGNYLQLYAFKALAYGRLGDRKREELYFNRLKRSDPYLYRQFKHYIEIKD